MKVTLFDYTGACSPNPSGYAASVLIFTKSTRLEMSPNLFEEILNLDNDRRLKELEYMANTIPSSWEFVDFTFLIEDVTRAFTHQLVRTRTASFAQQTMRVLDKGDFNYLTGPTIGDESDFIGSIYHGTMQYIKNKYNQLIENGVAIEDARGILPTNILTNIVMKINMRNFIDLVRKRSGLRVQDEYRSVLNTMVIEVERVYPWFYIFMKKDAMVAANKIDEEINKMDLTKEKKVDLFKLIDQIRKEL
jgi:flavin-dependent thymidylate synthase